MSGTKVYVVTGLELGWDCVVAVYDAQQVSKEQILEAWPKDQYVIHEQTLEAKVEL